MPPAYRLCITGGGKLRSEERRAKPREQAGSSPRPDPGRTPPCAVSSASGPAFLPGVLLGPLIPIFPHVRPADGHKESFWSDGNSLDLDCGDVVTNCKLTF